MRRRRGQTDCGNGYGAGGGKGRAGDLEKTKPGVTHVGQTSLHWIKVILR